MSLQTSNNFRKHSSSKSIKLSEVITQTHMSNGDSLNLSFSEISILDKIPGLYLKITKLYLSHNRLSSLSHIVQFQNLTHLNIAHNLISSVEELQKVPNRENLVVLCVDGNPFARHPDLTPLILQVFPRLAEIDGNKLSDHTRQDMSDGMILTGKLIEYICKNEAILEKFDQDVKRTKIEFELLQSCKWKITQTTGPYWEDINARHQKDLKKMLKIPKLPSFTYHSKIRPYMVLDYIDTVGKAVHYFLSDEVDSQTMQRLYKWLFCEILLHLHSWGMHGLQLFLQENTSSGDLDRCFEEELKFFQSLATEKAPKTFSDIFPVASMKTPAKTSENSWKNFPVFSCNPDFLKALLAVLQMQVKQIEELEREKQELLSFDTSCLGIPSFSEKYIEANRVCSFDLSQENRASSRATIKRLGSPNMFGASPREFFDSEGNPKKFQDIIQDDDTNLSSCRVNSTEKMRLQQEFLMKSEQDRIVGLLQTEKAKVAEEKAEIEEKIKQIEEIRNIEKEIEKERRGIESEKSFKLLKTGAGVLANFVKKTRVLWGFAAIKKICRNGLEIAEKDLQKAERHFNKKACKTAFLALRYNFIIAKTKKIKADDFYRGRLILDSFFAWKNIHVCGVTKKKVFKAEKPKKVKNTEDLALRKEFEKLLKRLTHSEKNIARLWKILKKKKNCIKRECLCGGFKCPSCIKEKTKFIKKELIYLKKKIVESRPKKTF